MKLNKIYKKFLKDRKTILNQVEGKEEIEARIKQYVKQKMEDNRQDYIQFNDLLTAPDLKKYFKIFIIVSVRNKGKNYQFRIKAEQCVKRGEVFLILRNTDKSILKATRGEEEWFKRNNWWFNKTEGRIFNVETNETVGWILSINTSMTTKGVEFPKVSLILYDEFNDKKISEKYFKLTQLITTIQRLRDKMSIYLTANYLDQNDDLLEKFGIGMESLKEDDFILFDWISGAILWFIPDDYYLGNREFEKTVGYRMSMKDFDTYKRQYLGSFTQELITNIVNIDDIYNVKPILTLNIQETKMYFYNGDKKGDDGKITNINFVTDFPYYDDNGVVFNFSSIEKMYNIDDPIISSEGIEYLIELWLNNKIMVTTKDIHTLLSMVFGKIHNRLQKDFLTRIEKV